MEIDTISYEQTYSDVVKAVEWLAGQGFDYSRTRIGFYERTIKDLVNTYKTASREKLNDSFPKYGKAIYEIFDLITIHEGLGRVSDVAVPLLLEKFLGGPPIYSDERPATSSNLGRNTAFQLLVASKLSEAQLRPRLEEPSDIGFRFEKYYISVECKRPQEKSGIQTSIKGALHQLKHRLGARVSRFHAGMIALDFTKVLNPELRLLVKKTPRELKSWLSAITNSFLEENVSLWQKPQKTRILGVLTHFSLMAVVEDRDLLTHCRQFALNPMEACGSKLKEIAWQLAERLGSTVREKLIT